MRRWLCRHRVWKCWRLRVDLDLSNVPRPVVTYANEADDWRYVTLALERPGSDPIIMAEFNLGAPR